MILEPCYEFLGPNENTILKQTKALIVLGENSHEIDVEVRLRLLPSTGIEIEGVLPEGLVKVDFDSIKKVTIEGKEIPGFLKETSGFQIQTNPFSIGKQKFVWLLKREPFISLGDADTEISCILFHIFNYKDFIGTRASIVEDDTGLHRIEHIDLKASGWHVELKSMLSTREIIKSLKEKGGYGLTHVGSIQKKDMSIFSGKSSEQMLNALRHFLSFSKGLWCFPCFAVGFDQNEKRVWESWSCPKENWHSPASWFDPHHCEQLVEFFPCFMDKWDDESWKECLHEVIYWYLNSNNTKRGIDAGIILTQSGIERLSYEYVVRQKRLIEDSGFKQLRASDKFRMLFSSLEIPIDIPSYLSDFQKLAKKFNWIDAPHALTEIRNSLIHPEHKRRGQFGQAFYPAWNLGQWYLELALLRICNYSGTYSNRLVQKYIGEVETVPWKK